jgi:isopropylmalate/homocitrate/citramalate synthase
MDGVGSEPALLSTLFSTIADEVTYCSVADTVGSRTPAGVRSFLDSLSTNLDRSALGVHFHDDLGVSTANALAAADQGVGKVDVSVAGVGERAGNTPLEEFVVAGVTGEEAVDLDIDVDELIPAAHSVVDTIEEDVPAGKPVLGRGAFEHESGLHTAAMLEDPSTFEPFDPSTFGGERRLLFGDASGRGAAEGLLERVGQEPTEERVDAVLDALASGEEYTLDEALDIARSIE